MISIEEVIYPISLEFFMREIFEVEPRKFDGFRCTPLITDEDLPLLVKAITEVCPNRLRVNCGGQVLLPPRNVVPTQLQDWAMAHYENGSTIILNYVEAIDLKCGKFARCLGESLGAKVSLTVFATPENSQGFVPHFDTLDVFVIQQSGSKLWSLGESAITLPTLKQGGLISFPDDEPPKTADFVLNEGETLYIPRGVIHWAKTSADASIHITADIGTASMGDVLSEANRLIQSVELTTQKKETNRLAILAKKPSFNPIELVEALLSVERVDNLYEESILKKWQKKVL